jgi:AcrR family transcriptional regulator
VQARSLAARRRILDAAGRHFAAHGYENARMEDVARELKIAKGLIFHYFGSKKRLLLEVLKNQSVTHLKYLDVPPRVLEKGFFAVVRYWLDWIEHLSEEERLGFRLWVIASYGAGLEVRGEVSRMLRTEDPSGVIPFVRMGLARGEVRDDLDAELVARTLEMFIHTFEESWLAEEVDAGLFRSKARAPEANRDRVNQYFELIRSAIARR